METLTQLWESVQVYLPNMLGAVGILVAGTVVAWIIARIVRAALKRTTLDDRLAAWLTGDDGEPSFAVEDVFGKIVFYTLMLFVLVAFLQTLGLTVLTEPINALLNRVFEFAPQVLGGIVLIVVAWVIASALRMITTKLLSQAKLDDKVGETAGTEGKPPVALSKSLGEAVYWLVFLLFLPAILGALGLTGILQPVQGMVDKVLQYIPNIVSAAAILLVGWFVARVVQRILASLLAAAGADRLSENVGIDKALGEQRLSSLIALVAYVLILIPVLVSALNALGMDAITQPASNMLDTMLAALPALFGAALIVVVAFVVAKVVSGLVSGLLRGVGFNNLIGKLGLNVSSAPEERDPSSIVGYVLMAAILLFAIVEAFGMLGFATLSEIFAQLIEFGGHLLVGLIIFGAGMYLANLAGDAIEAGGNPQAGMLAIIARAAILVLSGAMALRELGVADEIITLAFGLTLGAIAVAAAIAFGIGGRDLAAKQLQRWTDSMRKS